MWSLIENASCVLEIHVVYAFVGPCGLYMPVQCLLHFSEISNVRCIYIFTCYSFLVNWPFYHYTIFILLQFFFFFLQFILSDITASPALFSVFCLFPPLHFSPFHVLTNVSSTCFTSLTNSVSLALGFSSCYFPWPLLMCIVWWWKTGPLDCSFHATVISEGMYWMFPSYHDVSWDSLA